MSDLANPLLADNELSYDFSGFDVNVSDMYNMVAPKGVIMKPHWDEESGQYYMSHVEAHNELDLIQSGKTIEDITTVIYAEPIYFVGAGSHELGEVSREWDVQDSGTVNMSEGWLTEAQMRERWNADEGMGYFKKANPHMDFDAYFAMVQDGTMRYQAAGGLMAGEQDNFLAELAADHGVQTTWKNSDGDVFNFTGGGYAKSFKVDDHLSPGDYMKMGITAAVGIVAGPALAGSLTGALGAAGAKAASAAIINAATQLVTTGELDWKQALISAATAYGGAKLGEALAGAGELDGIVGKIVEAGDEVQSKVDAMLEFVSQGNSIAEAAIKAGGMSMLTQLVTTGEVNMEQAALAALQAAGSQGFQEWKASMEAAGQEVGDDVLQEVVVEAKRVGTDVGGGMTALDNGLVINEAGDIIGNMDDLDLDGDGMLSGNDLQEITTPDRELVDPNLTRDPDSYYDVDGDGQYTEGVDTDLTAPGETTNPDAFTNEWADERYAGLSGDQIIDQMQRDGFTDDQINGYMEHWNATNDLNLQELNTASYGAIDVNMEDKYTIGQTEEGTYYIAKVEENGEVSFTSISEDQYNDLYGEMYGSADTGEGALTSGDYAGVDAYIEGEGIGSTGNEFTGVDPFTGEGVLTEGDGWITLEEGDDTSTAVPIDVVDEADPVEETSDTDDDSAANADPNDNVNAGEGDSGGGATDSTGGSGDSGQSGGGGEQGAGDTAGSVDPDFTLPPWLNEFLDSIDTGTDSEVPVSDDGEGLGGIGGDTGGTDEGEGTGGVGGGSESGSGDDAGPDVGDGTGTGEGGSGGGSGDSGDTAGGDGTGGGLGDGGGVGEGTGGGQNDGDGTGGSVGVGVGSGTEPGAGAGAGGGGLGGDGDGGGMMSGHDPQWGELFGYTPFKVYEPGRGLEPVSGLLKGLLK